MGFISDGSGKKPRYDPTMSEPIKLFGKLSEYYPEPEVGDRIIGTAAALASLVPQFETFTGFVSAWLSPPLEKRKEQWCKMLADVVQELCDRFQGFDPHKLTDNQVFVSAVIQTNRIAVGTHQAEKLAMLRNALVRIGSGTITNDDLLHIYFRIVEELTPLHVCVLNLIWTGASQMAQRSSPYTMETTYIPLMQEQYPELMRNRELLGYIIRNLTDFHLIENKFPGRVFPDVPLSPGHMTNEGINFLRFVLAPEHLPK